MAGEQLVYFNMLEASLPSGWRVEKGDRGLLVALRQGGGRLCVDGRPLVAEFDGDLAYGLKIQGGTEGDALMIAKDRGKRVVDEQIFREACQRNVDYGLRPTVHDLEHDPVHCGHCKLLMAGKFGRDWPRLAVTPERMIEIVEEYGGVHVHLQVEHAEERVRVNFVQGTTLLPQWEAFNLDAHTLLGAKLTDVLSNALATVAGLSKTVRTIQVFE